MTIVSIAHAPMLIPVHLLILRLIPSDPTIPSIICISQVLNVPQSADYSFSSDRRRRAASLSSPAF